MRVHLLRAHRTSLALLGLSITAAGALASGPAAQAAQPSKATTFTTAAAKGNGSGVVLRYAVPQRIAVGETATVRLAFSGVSGADGATVEVTEAEGGRSLLATRLAQGERREVDLSVTGRSDGVQYLTVVTTQGDRSTVQQVPLAVGSGKRALKEHGTRQTTPAGEAVISLPANK